MNIWTWSLNFGSSCYLSPCCWRSVHRVQAPWYTSDHPKHCPIQTHTHTHTHLQPHWCQQLQFAHTLHLGNLINRPFTALLLPYIGLFKRESYHTMNTMCLIFSVKKGEPTLRTRLACLLCGWLQHQCVVVSTSMPTGAAVAALALYNGIWDDTNSPSTHHLMMMAELGQLGPYVVWVWVWVCVCVLGVCLIAHSALWMGDRQQEEKVGEVIQRQESPHRSPFLILCLSCLFSQPRRTAGSPEAST